MADVLLVFAVVLGVLVVVLGGIAGAIGLWVLFWRWYERRTANLLADVRRPVRHRRPRIVWGGGRHD